MQFMIRENGKNGTVEVRPDRLVRTIKHFIMKDDVQTIPIRAITEVQYDRRHVSTDRVLIQVGTRSYTWKVKDAGVMVDALHDRMFA